MKKRLSILIAVCILAAGMTALPLSAGSNETKAYTDLDAQAWYYPGVAYMVTNGLMVGMSDASFEPETKLTRRHVCGDTEPPFPRKANRRRGRTL